MSENEPLFDPNPSPRNDTIKTQELAEVDEETKACIQMQDIESSTVEPGKIMVEVKAVATSEDNERIAITVAHPIDGQVTFHLSKPRTWDPDNELVQFLDWYGLSVPGIYQLQTHDVCIRRDDGRVKSWELCEPPDYSPDLTLRERVRGRLPPVPRELHVLTFIAMASVTVVTTTVGTVLGSTAEPSTTMAGVGFVGFLVGLIGALGMAGVAILWEEFSDG